MTEPESDSHPSEEPSARVNDSVSQPVGDGADTSGPAGTRPGQKSANLPIEQDEAIEARMRALSRSGFLGMGASSLLGILGFGWLLGQKQEQGILWPLRQMLGYNEGLSQAFFRPGRLAPTFPRTMAKEPRANGNAGLEQHLDAASWKLQVFGIPAAQLANFSRQVSLTSQGEILELNLAQVRTLPHQEMITELKCIEGWSQVVHWGGVRFQDFVAKYYPELLRHPEQMPYVSIETPDGAYYVGLDTASALHPQTLLCYEMNGEPLSDKHGAPLRLVIPVKYGVKNIKRIGRIRFMQARPADYWAERGYDWYAGH